MAIKEIQDVNLWRYEDLTKSKKKHTDDSYEEDVENIYEKMKKGVKLIWSKVFGHLKK